MRHFTVHHDGVTIPVSRGGQGRPLVLCPGLSSTQADLHELADLPVFRAMWADMAAEQEGRRGTPRQVLLTGPEILDLNLEIDDVRSRILDRYRRIDRPIRMIMSTSMAGDGGEELAVRCNRNWRAGAERLVRERPDVAVSWLEADHGLVFTHAPEVARLVASPAPTS